MIRKYLVIDLETNALPKSGKRQRTDFSAVHPVEIGVIGCIADDSGVKEMTPWSSLVKLPPEYKLDPGAQAVNGLSAEKLETEGFELAAVLETVRGLVSVYDTIVGHNLYAFDLTILRRLDRDTPQWTYSVFHDTKLLWNAWTLGMKREDNEDVAFFYGRVAQQKTEALSNLKHVWQTMAGLTKAIPSHRALADCNTCMCVYEAMRQRGIFSDVMGM